MTELTIQITFSQPFRIVPWKQKEVSKTDKKYLRGGTYARWHKIKGDTGKPYITGTLLRSVLLNEIDKILVLFNPFQCCSKEKLNI